MSDTFCLWVDRLLPLTAFFSHCHMLPPVRYRRVWSPFCASVRRDFTVRNSLMQPFQQIEPSLSMQQSADLIIRRLSLNCNRIIRALPFLRYSVRCDTSEPTVLKRSYPFLRP